MTLTRRGFLFGTLAAVVTAAAGPVAKVVAAPVVVPPVVPSALFRGEIGVWQGVKIVERFDGWRGDTAVALYARNTRNGDIRARGVRGLVTAHDIDWGRSQLYGWLNRLNHGDLEAFV